MKKVKKKQMIKFNPLQWIEELLLQIKTNLIKTLITI